MQTITYTARRRIEVLGETFLPQQRVPVERWPAGLAKKLEDAGRIVAAYGGPSAAPREVAAVAADAVVVAPVAARAERLRAVNRRYGWFELPDGRRVQGRGNVEAMGYEVVEPGPN